jgi:hypothetical protein
VPSQPGLLHFFFTYVIKCRFLLLQQLTVEFHKLWDNLPPPPTQETCCQAAPLVDCTGRQDYPAPCPNPPVSQPYPADPALFPDWRVAVESRATTYRPLLLLLVQILSSLAAYQLSYFAFETRIEIFGFAIPMVVGPLVVLGSLATMCGRHVGQDECRLFADHVPALASIFFSCPAEFTSLEDFLADNWIFLLAFAAQVAFYSNRCLFAVHGHFCSSAYFIFIMAHIILQQFTRFQLLFCNW